MLCSKSWLTAESFVLTHKAGNRNLENSSVSFHVPVTHTSPSFPRPHSFIRPLAFLSALPHFLSPLHSRFISAVSSPSLRSIFSLFLVISTTFIIFFCILYPTFHPSLLSCVHLISYGLTLHSRFLLSFLFISLNRHEFYFFPFLWSFFSSFFVLALHHYISWEGPLCSHLTPSNSLLLPSYFLLILQLPPFYSI